MGTLEPAPDRGRESSPTSRPSPSPTAGSASDRLVTNGDAWFGDGPRGWGPV